MNLLIEEKERHLFAVWIEEIKDILENLIKFLEGD